MAKKRTLLVSLGIVDERFAAKLASLRRGIRRWARRVTGFFTAPLRALTSIRTAVLGIGLALAARAGAASFQGVIDTTDQLTKLATATGDAVENLSELRFAFQLNGVAANQFEQVLKGLGRRQAQALRGQTSAVEAFERLGISVQELRELSPSQIFEEMSRGLERFGNEQEKASALQVIFEENFQRLLPLLGRGVTTFQDSIREGRRYGATITELDGRISEGVNDSLLRFRTAVEDVQRALITAFGNDTSALLTQFAGRLADSKDEVVEFARTIASSLGSALDVVSESLLAVVSGFETVQDFFGESALERAQRDLRDGQIGYERLAKTIALARGEVQVFNVDLSQQGQELLAMEPGLQRVARGLVDLINSQRGAASISDAFRDAQEELDRLGRELERRQGLVEDIASSGGIAGFLRRQRDETVAEFQALLADIQAEGRAAPIVVPVRFGLEGASPDAVQELLEQSGSVFRAGTGNPLALAADESSTAAIAAVKGYEELAGAVQAAGLASEEFLAVQQQLQVDALEIDLARAYVEGSVDAQEFHRIQEEILAGQARLKAAADKDITKNIREARRAFLELLPPTQKTREELQRIAREEQIDAFRDIAAAAGIAAEKIDEMVAKLRQVRGNGGGTGAKRGLTGSAPEELEAFGVGFRAASDAAAEFYTSARAGADAYRTIQDGLVDGINDWVSGTKSAKEAFADLGQTVLQELQKIIIRLIVVRALNSVFGSDVTTPSGNANGGIQTGTIVGTSPVEGFANGGVSDGPTLALFGEGRYRREAFVPLPDGRRIPVDLQNAGGGDSGPTVQFIFQGGDGDSIRRMLKKEESTIIGIVSRAAGTNTGLRRAIGRN